MTSRRRVRNGLAILAIAASLAPAVRAEDANARPAADGIWITDVTIVSPEKLDRVEVGDVLIERGRIVAVERGGGMRKRREATIVSGKGQFLIPGLIDSHIHLAVVPGMMIGAVDKSPMADEYFKQLPRSYLYFGFTTLVDLAVIDRQVLEDFRRAPLHPDLYDCGEPLVFANGYPMSFIPLATRFKLFPNFIYDPRQASAIPAEFEPEDHTPAAGVARVKKSGAVCVKTFYERGFARAKNLPVMGSDVFAQIRQAARQDGLVLMVHANSFDAQRFAVDGNADVIAHGMWHWGEFDKSPELPLEIRKLLDAIIEKKIGYQATIRVLYGEREYFDPGYLDMEQVSKVVPRSLLDWFRSPEGRAFKKELVDGDTPDAVMRDAYDKGPLRRVRQVVAYLARKNAKFLLGSDTPSAPTYGNLPGLNGYLEMRELRAAGLSLAQILRAATIDNAREFGIDAQVGTIEPGKAANLVLLAKSPLESVDAYDSITAVWIHGKRVARESLAAPR